MFDRKNMIIMIFGGYIFLCLPPWNLTDNSKENLQFWGLRIYEIQVYSSLLCLFLAENQLCFDCNFRRGTTDPREPTVYDCVTVRGSFRHWNGESKLKYKYELWHVISNNVAFWQV